MDATEYATAYINGNRVSTCREILGGPNPAVMASQVTLALIPLGGTGTAEEFIRLLATRPLDGRKA